MLPPSSPILFDGQIILAIECAAHVLAPRDAGTQNPCGLAPKKDEVKAIWTTWGAPTEWVVLVGLQYRSSNWLWTEVEIGADNTISGTGCPNAEEADSCFEVTIKKVQLPKWWIMGGEFFDVTPDTPYRVMVGSKLTDCPGSGSILLPLS